MDDEHGAPARRRRRRRTADAPPLPGPDLAPGAAPHPAPSGTAPSETVPARPDRRPAQTDRQPGQQRDHQHDQQRRGRAREADSASRDEQRRRGRASHDGGERGLRDLVGAGHSQLGVNGALRARDLNRPTEDDLAEAEQTVVLVRRNWQPPDSRA